MCLDTSSPRSIVKVYRQEQCFVGPQLSSPQIMLISSIPISAALPRPDTSECGPNTCNTAVFTCSCEPDTYPQWQWRCYGPQERPSSEDQSGEFTDTPTAVEQAEIEALVAAEFANGVGVITETLGRSLQFHFLTAGPPS